MPSGVNHANRLPNQMYRSQGGGGINPSAETVLPDGVKITPLDAAAVNMLNGLGIKVPSPPAAPQQEQKPAPPQNAAASGGGYAGSLREMIQDEHNSSRFYAYLADKAPSAAYTGYLKRESKNCGERADKLNLIHEQYARGRFVPAEAPINSNIGFAPGISLAAVVESRALGKYGALYENAPDERCARKLFSQICGKVSHAIMLFLIMHNREIDI